MELDSPELEVAAEPQPEPSALDGDKAEQEIQALAHAVMPAKNVASSKSVITEKVNVTALPTCKNVNIFSGADAIDV